MARTWDDYAKEKAELLAECDDADSVLRTFATIQNELDGWKTSVDLRRAFWKKLAVVYAKEPKLVKEAAAGEKLGDLKSMVDAYITQQASK